MCSYAARAFCRCCWRTLGSTTVASFLYGAGEHAVTLVVVSQLRGPLGDRSCRLQAFDRSSANAVRVAVAGLPGLGLGGAGHAVGGPLEVLDGRGSTTQVHGRGRYVDVDVDERQVAASQPRRSRPGPGPSRRAGASSRRSLRTSGTGRTRSASAVRSASSLSRLCCPAPGRPRSEILTPSSSSLEIRSSPLTGRAETTSQLDLVLGNTKAGSP